MKTLTSHALQLILDAKHHDPFAYLGLHQEGKKYVFRAFLPYATKVSLKTQTGWVELERTHHHGFYEWHGNQAPDTPCLIKIQIGQQEIITYNTYSFLPVISEDDLHLFGEGQLNQAYTSFGARMMEHQGVKGTRFSVWAPNAERVSVIGNFNQWDGRINPMRIRGSSGVWEIFIPNLGEGELYKFEIRNRHTGAIMIKTDPYAQAYEVRPGNAAKIIPASQHRWQDEPWLSQRANYDWLHSPFNCYEAHLGSWKRNANGDFLSYRELAEQLVPYLVEMGYTHVELLPITEHPLNESWGYQTTGYFAATNRFGSPDDLRYFVDACHQANIGVILDWVPGHFPKDDWALARFDGTALYEHEDPRLGEHQDWGTYIFNYGRNEVRNFLVSNAYFWLKEFHIDGLRVDAVASMLYLDYSRKEGEWIPNKYGGRENLEVIEFIKQLNTLVHQDFPGALTIAEESTAWPAVSRPVYLGGLGFSMKWNMGWMNDTLSYMQNDPVHRRYHHDKLTFGQLYAYSENFVLPFSHDEVVHGKKSLLDKMPGDAWQKFANLRLLFTLQSTHPGKKLNFMGNEFAQGREWSVNQSLDWHLLDNEWHQGVQRVSHDLNKIYRNSPALYDLDFESSGFQWIDCHDSEQSIVSYIRRARNGSFLVVVLNFTPVLRSGYRVGVPQPGFYREIFNSDAACYGGSNQGNVNGLNSEELSWMNLPYSVQMTIPPLAGIILSI
ncbi:MAG TPA: 1,4-alpha-glucan branching protein GlgB [Methylophilus sp.]|nr:1,4-alpha-glucan branching protein GlgB [Methylophilus sp.]HQQ33528.1 1,4-alpha-glucan branching protein GlgB [Methylophilus sp.]